MKTIKKTTDIKLNNSQLSIINETSLLFDIETTGLSSKYCHIYAIGAAYLKEGTIYFEQFFAETPDDEIRLIESFITLSKGFARYISFNGINFDTRFLIDRAGKYNLSAEVLTMEHFDLYKMIKPYKNILGLSSLRQQSLEAFLHNGRIDTNNGGELIEYYNEYLASHDHSLLDALLLHNEEDVFGLIELSKLHSYVSLFTDEPKGQISILEVNDTEAIYLIDLSEPVPVSINIYKDNMYFRVEQSRAYIKLPIYSGRLKHFFDNFKDYFYYPDEDMAIHKSLAMFSESTHRKKATAKTAYQNRESSYLPATGNEDIIFYDEYKGRPYVELDDNLKTPDQKLTGYLNNIIKLFL